MKISKDSIVLKQVANILNIDSKMVKARAVELNAQKLLSLQKAQMRYGLDSGGNFFYPYVPWYAAYKASLDTYFAPIGVPDLFLTGEFQQEMDILIDYDYYEFISYVPYAQEVLNKYPRAFGLSAKYMNPAMIAVTASYTKLTHNLINQ